MNIRKNKIEFFFNEHYGNIEDVIFDYSIVDENGKEIERKKESVKDIYDEIDDGKITYPVKTIEVEGQTLKIVEPHSFTETLGFWIEFRLDEIKKREGIRLNGNGYL